MKIRWEERKYERGVEDTFVSVDGTDCRIQEPSPFSSDWYSHKFNGPGLRYEVAVSISSGLMCWVNGPYPAGLYPDIKIFNEQLKEKLGENEKVLADGGYRGPKCRYSYSNQNELLSGAIRARHEKVNRRMKQFRILSTTFRHEKYLHVYCFHAIANLTQLMLRHEPMFSLNKFL